MGKRELVLVLAFVVAGAIVYQFTAPAATPGQRGVVNSVLQHFRQAVHGRPAHASVQKTRTDALDASVSEVRINVRSVDLTVVGEDRADVATTMTVDSDGMDAAEAQRLATATELQVDRAGGGMRFGIHFPEDGRQRAALEIHVPKRFIVRVEAKSGKLDVQQVAAVDAKGNRGESRISDVAGEVALTHRGDTLTVAGAGSIRLTVSGGDAHVSEIRGTASIDVTGSNIDLASIRGPLDVKSRNSDIKLQDAETLEPLLRFDVQSGRLEIDGLQTETRIEGRDTEIRIAMARAVPVTIYNTNDDITMTAPPDAYSLDAVATDGELTIEDGASTGVDVKKAADEHEQRASGAVRGGGPSIMLRNTGGDISIRKREEKEK